MFPINYSIDFRSVQFAILFGVCSFCMVLFCTIFPFKLTLFFLSVPLFISYLTYGSKYGLISSLISSVAIFIFIPLELASDMFLNMIAPAILLGHFSVKSITIGRKIWWYPESFLLQHFVILSCCSVIFLSFTFYSEDYLLKIYQETAELLLKPDNPNNALIHQYLSSSVKYFVGIGVLSKMILTFLNFYLAHSFSAKYCKSIRPLFDILNLRISNLIALIPLVSLTTAYLFPKVSFSFFGLFVVGLFAPSLTGFSIIHKFANMHNKKRILITFYIMLFFIPFAVLTGTVLLGVVDSFYPCRKKLENF